MAKNSKCTEKKGEANRKFRDELCYKFSLWRSKHHKTSQPSFGYKGANKTQALWSQKLPLAGSSGNLSSCEVSKPICVSIYCLSTQQIKTRPAPSCVEAHCGWLANPELPLPGGIFAIQSPFWLLIKEGQRQPSCLQRSSSAAVWEVWWSPSLLLF